MPTYDYRCATDHVFAVFHSITDDSPRTCPECGTGAKRVPGGGAGLLFRGSGFHVTDYRSASYKEKAKSESAPKPAEPKKPPGGAGKGE